MSYRLSHEQEELMAAMPESKSSMIKSAMQLAYMQGLEDGIRRFAWWKDGIQYVGSCGTKLNEALVKAFKEII